MDIKDSGIKVETENEESLKEKEMTTSDTQTRKEWEQTVIEEEEGDEMRVKGKETVARKEEMRAKEGATKSNLHQVNVEDFKQNEESVATTYEKEEMGQEQLISVFENRNKQYGRDSEQTLQADGMIELEETKRQYGYESEQSLQADGTIELDETKRQYRCDSEQSLLADGTIELEETTRRCGWDSEQPLQAEGTIGLEETKGRDNRASHRRDRQTAGFISHMPFECEKCGKTFTTQQFLDIHLDIHSQSQSEDKSECKCKQCGKVFSSTSGLSRHNLIHLKEKPYSCKECGKTFARQDNLKTHNRTHSGEKPYSCKICGKAFCAQSNFTRHKRTH